MTHADSRQVPQSHWNHRAQANARTGRVRGLVAALVGAAALLQCSCSSGDAIHVRIDSATHVALSSTSTVRIRLYGRDLDVADAAATLLNEYRYQITTLPASYRLDFQPAWLDKIEPKSGNGRYAYALVVLVHPDDKGAGPVYMLDYDRTDQRLYAHVISDVSDLSGTYYVKPYVAVQSEEAWH